MGEVTKIPYWKKLLSHAKPVIVEQSQSPYNPQLHVILEKGELQLCTEDAIYSYGRKYYNFRDAFKVINVKEKDFSDVLLLGLGLGSIPLILEKSFKLYLNYTAVEIDEEVVALANKYVLGDLQSKMEFFCTDAVAYVSMEKSKYDLIAMDIFQGCTVPEKFQTISYMENLKRMLNPQGILIFNMLAIDADNKKENEEFFNKFSIVFPDAAYCDIRYNRMFFNRLDK